MLRTYNQCHSLSFAREQSERGDQMIKKADLLMAEAIRTVAELYKDGILNKPEIYPYPFSALLEFHDAPNEIEQKLFEMFCKHRARALQGTFHLNPDYAEWHGESEMRRGLTEFKDLAAAMQKKTE